LAWEGPCGPGGQPGRWSGYRFGGQSVVSSVRRHARRIRRRCFVRGVGGDQGLWLSDGCGRRAPRRGVGGVGGVRRLASPSFVLAVRARVAGRSAPTTARRHCPPSPRRPSREGPAWVPGGWLGNSVRRPRRQRQSVDVSAPRHRSAAAPHVRSTDRTAFVRDATCLGACGED